MKNEIRTGYESPRTVIVEIEQEQCIASPNGNLYSYENNPLIDELG